MRFRFFEISEMYHTIQNPITDDKLMLLGEICRLKPGMRQLDLACGKGEMLCRYAQKYGITGTGVDISLVFLEAARARAQQLGVEDNVQFTLGDAAKYSGEPNAYDIVSCIGATWIGEGMVGTIKLMRPALKPDGLLLVGEPYWIEHPPDAAYDMLGVRRTDYCTLPQLLDRFEAARVELIEMVLANQDSWDRYEGQRWLAVSDWLRAHPDDPDAGELRTWIKREREVYLQYGRRYLGWGVFVLRPMETG